MEFLALLINGEFQRMPLPRAPISQVWRPRGCYSAARPLNTDCRRRCDSVQCRIKEYPTQTVVGMYNGLLSAPFPFCFDPVVHLPQQDNRPGLLQRQHVRMANAGDFAVSQARNWSMPSMP